MSLLKGKLARISAAGLSATALVVALVEPGTVLGQSITLHKCSAGDGDPTCLARVQVRVPSVAPMAPQSGNVEPSASADQSNKSNQSTDNSNRFSADSSLGQA